MDQLQVLVECDECGGVALVTPISDDDIGFCCFCGSSLDKPATENE